MHVQYRMRHSYITLGGNITFRTSHVRMNAFNGETLWYDEQFLNHIIAESGIIITLVNEENYDNNQRLLVE